MNSTLSEHPVAATLVAGVLLGGLPFVLVAVSWPITPTLLILPALLFGPAPAPLITAIPMLLFWAWAPQLFRGQAEVPERSLWGLTLLSVVQFFWCFTFWPRMAEHPVLVIGSVFAFLAVWLLAVLAQRRASFPSSLAFHLATVLWFSSIALPDLGGWP